MKERTILAIMEKYSSDCMIGNLHDDETTICFIGDWHSIPSYVERYIGRHFENVVFGFRDEFTTCSNCGQIVKTSPDCYGWLPDYWVGDGELQCETCARKESFVSYIEDIVNDHNQANTMMSHEELEQAGFEIYNCGYETGFHPHQTDSPEKVLQELQQENPDLDYLFSITGAGQFDVNWCVYCRKSE